MSRGKYSSAARARYAASMELENRALRKEIAAVKREHEITRRIADESERLKQRCRALELDLELATTAELARLQLLVTEQREALRGCDRRFDFLRRYIRSMGRRFAQERGALPMRSTGELENVASALGISAAELTRGWTHFDKEDFCGGEARRAPVNPRLHRVTELPEDPADWAVRYED